MSLRYLAALPLILATVAASSQAQARSQHQPGPTYEAQPAPYAQPPYDTQNAPEHNYGYSYHGYGNFDFDGELLGAVNACANRAAGWNLGRLTINEVRRTYYRFVVRGMINRYRSYGEGSDQYGYGHNYPPPRVPFTCSVDSYGRVISWTPRE